MQRHAESAGKGSRPDPCSPDHDARAHQLTAELDDIRLTRVTTAPVRTSTPILRSDASARWESEVCGCAALAMVARAGSLTRCVYQTYRFFLSFCFR